MRGLSRGMRGFRTSPIVEDSGGTSLRVHLGYLLVSGPALALVLRLPMKCFSRTPGLEFRCRIISREEGYCVSWVPLGVERVACMTAAYMETSSRTLSNEVVYGSCLNFMPIWCMREYSFDISKIVEESLCCIKVG